MNTFIRDNLEREWCWYSLQGIIFILSAIMFMYTIAYLVKITIKLAHRTSLSDIEELKYKNMGVQLIVWMYLFTYVFVKVTY